MASIAQHDYTPTTRKMLYKYGEKFIQKVQVIRKPIQQIYEFLLNLLSLWSWAELKAKYGYEQFFHLALLIQIDGKNITFEKNSIVEITNTEGLENEEGAEIMQCPRVPTNTTFGLFVAQTRRLMGDTRFFGYESLPVDGRTQPNNCQTFVMAALEANRMLTPQLKTFIFQDLEKLASELPNFTKKVSKYITDLYSILNKGLSYTKEAVGLKKGGEIGFKGKVPSKGIPKELLNKDCVPAILTPGELVINKKNVPLVEKYLKRKGIRLPGMR